MSKEKTEQEAYLQLAAMCAQAEHCEQEMRDKMKRWGIEPDAQDRVVARLVKERYVDNERYARMLIMNDMPVLLSRTRSAITNGVGAR